MALRVKAEDVPVKKVVLSAESSIPAVGISACAANDRAKDLGGRKMATFGKVLAILGIVFAVSTSSGKVSWGQSQVLTAFYTAHVVSMAPMWIAKEAGLFKKHGADVRLLFIGSGPLGTTSILAGEVDLGIIGGFAPIRAVLGGAKNLVIIGQSKTYMVGAIVGKKEIASVQDLRGKRLGIDRIGSNPDMYTQAALSRFQMDPLRDLSYIQMGSTSQGIPALKAGSIDAFTTTPPYDLFSQRLGYKVILDITALKIPFAATVLVSTRSTVARKQPEMAKFMRAYAEAVRTFLTKPEAAAKIVEKYTKVEDKEVLVHSMAAEAKAMERTLQVDPKGIELILGLISKTVPQAASARPEDFYDARFFTELKESGFLKRLWES
jgi:NitT/TauT family transport system substrate-binding protein